MTEYKLDPNLLVSGRRISLNHYSAYAAQRVKYDDNVSLVSEENNVSQSLNHPLFMNQKHLENTILSLKRNTSFLPKLDSTSYSIVTNKTLMSFKIILTAFITTFAPKRSIRLRESHRVSWPISNTQKPIAIGGEITLAKVMPQVFMSF